MSKPSLYFLIGFFWAGANCIPYPLDNLKYFQALIIVPIIFLFWIIDYKSLWFWTHSRLGWIVFANTAGAILSWIICEDKQSDVLRYIVLVPIFSIILYISSRDLKTKKYFFAGLVIASSIYLSYLSFLVDYRSIADPLYRFNVPNDHPNRIAFIAATIVIILFWSIQKAVVPKNINPFIVFIIGLFFIVLLATKSRTGLLEVFAGVGFELIFNWLIFQKGQLKIALCSGGLAILGLGLIFQQYTFQFLSTFSTFFSLFDPYRSIETGTGRYENWAFTIHNIWLPNFFLGIGPGNNPAYISQYSDFESIDNAYINSLAEVGIIGTIPLMIIAIMCVRKILSTKSVRGSWAAPIFIGCFITSMADNYFFSMGTPVGLIFMFSITYILIHENTKNNEGRYEKR